MATFLIFFILIFSPSLFSTNFQKELLESLEEEEGQEKAEQPLIQEKEKKMKNSQNPFSNLTQAVQTDQVLLRGLNKITAKVQDIIVPVGEKINFGTLVITAHLCQKSAPEDFPDSIAFLEVTENKGGGALQKIFKGWMFASSPALSAIEHPVYDIWVQHCQGKPIKTVHEYTE